MCSVYEQPILQVHCIGCSVAAVYPAWHCRYIPLRSGLILILVTVACKVMVSTYCKPFQSSTKDGCTNGVSGKDLWHLKNIFHLFFKIKRTTNTDFLYTFQTLDFIFCFQYAAHYTICYVIWTTTFCVKTPHKMR